MQDKHGILLPQTALTSLEPHFSSSDENTTLIFTTDNGEPMLRSEIDQCIKLYKQEFGVFPRTAVIPRTLEPYAKELERDFKLIVKMGAPRHNQITLTQI